MAKIKISKNPRNLNNPKNILITGGCGFIGVNLVNHLSKKGFAYIRILDNLSTGTKENLEDALRDNGEITSKIEANRLTYRFRKNHNPNIPDKFVVDLFLGDIRSDEMCLKATKNIGSVIHLAAHAGVVPSVADPFHDFEVNIQGTLNLLNASLKNNVDKFIFASSNTSLGDQVPPMSEEKVPRPLSPYGASKLACEGYCSAFYRSYGLKTICLRFSNAYGPYSLHKNSVVAKFIKDGLLRGELTIHGDGQQTRDFIHVDDISQALHLILEKPLTSKEIWGIPLNLGTGEETSILELAKIVQGLFAHRMKISFESERKGEIRRNYSDITKAKMVLGFSPRISIRNGGRLVYRWFTSKHITEIEKAHMLSR
jgi:UDP-glucose 4-epimerase